MDTITFAWTEAGQRKTQTFVDTFSTEDTWTIRIGRDPAQCDLVLPSLTASDRTVSRLHVEIAFNPTHASFYLRNLKPSNPVQVDGQAVAGKVVLKEGSIIRMGEVEVNVASLSDVPQTIFASGGESSTATNEVSSQTAKPVPLNMPIGVNPEPIGVNPERKSGTSTELAPIPKATLSPPWWEEIFSGVAKQLGSLPKPTPKDLLKPIPITIGIGILAVVGAVRWWRSQTITSHQAFFNSRVVEVRAPISGELRLQEINSGQIVQTGIVLGNVFDPRNLALQRSQRNLVSQLENLVFRQEQLQVQLEDRRTAYRDFEQKFEQLTNSQEASQQTMVGRRQAELQQAIQAAENAETELVRVQGLMAEGVVSQDVMDRAAVAKEEALELVSRRRELLAEALLESERGGGSAPVADSPELIAALTRRQELQNEIANFEYVLQSLQSQTSNKQAELNDIREELQVQTPVAVVSPENGEIWSIEYQANTSDLVVAGDPIANIATCNDMWVEAFVSQGDADNLAVGAEAKVLLSGNLLQRSISGIIREINSQVKPVDIEGEIAIPARELKSGEVAVLVDINPNSGAGSPSFCDVGRSTEVRFPRTSSLDS